MTLFCFFPTIPHHPLCAAAPAAAVKGRRTRTRVAPPTPPPPSPAPPAAPVLSLPRTLHPHAFRPLVSTKKDYTRDTRRGEEDRGVPSLAPTRPLSVSPSRKLGGRVRARPEQRQVDGPDDGEAAAGPLAAPARRGAAAAGGKRGRAAGRRGRAPGGRRPRGRRAGRRRRWEKEGRRGVGGSGGDHPKTLSPSLTHSLPVRQLVQHSAVARDGGPDDGREVAKAEDEA